MNQNPANGFSNEALHGIGLSPLFFGSGTQVAGLGMLEASGYGFSDSKLGIFNHTFPQHSFSGSFMADQKFINILILQVMQQDIITTVNSSGIQGLNNTFSVHDGPSHNGLESFTDQQGFTEDLVLNVSNTCFLLDDIQRRISHFAPSLNIKWRAFTELQIVQSSHSHMFQLFFLSFPPNLNERRRKKKGYTKILRLEN
jgi:hypothetical protein